MGNSPQAPNAAIPYITPKVARFRSCPAAAADTPDENAALSVTGESGVGDGRESAQADDEAITSELTRGNLGGWPVQRLGSEGAPGSC